MPRPFVLPDLGEGLTEAEIVKVLVNEGDVLAEDAPLLEVETDKATVEIPSPFGGRVERIHVRPGQSVKVGDVLVTFDDAAGSAPGGRGGLEQARSLGGAAAPGFRRRGHVRCGAGGGGAGGGDSGDAAVGAGAWRGSAGGARDRAWRPGDRR